MTNDTSLESSCALLLESAKKNCNFAKIEFFFAKSSYIVKMFVKKTTRGGQIDPPAGIGLMGATANVNQT